MNLYFSYIIHFRQQETQKNCPHYMFDENFEVIEIQFSKNI